MCVKIDGREVTLGEVNEAIVEMELSLTTQEIAAAAFPTRAEQVDMKFLNPIDGTTTWEKRPDIDLEAH